MEKCREQEREGFRPFEWFIGWGVGRREEKGSRRGMGQVREAGYRLLRSGESIVLDLKCGLASFGLRDEGTGDVMMSCVVSEKLGGCFRLEAERAV
jgi:hypothetical protein